MFSNIIAAFGILLHWDCIIALIIGVVAGMIVGVVPGLGPSVGIALLIPITFTMSPAAALTMMTAIYTCGVYGGSITAALCHTPGTAASAATALDGYELTKQGRGMEAIGVCTLASVCGGIMGSISLLFFAPPLGRLSLRFSSLEYFLVACFGVIIVSNLAGKNMSKGLFSAALGVLLGTVGMDPITGVARFTFGNLFLEDGIDYTPVLIGLFAVAQAMILVDGMAKGKSTILEDPTKGLQGRILPPWKELKGLFPIVLRSGIVGAFIGFIPAAGASIASWINYSFTKKNSKHPELFGHGSIEGVAASEAGNNAACGGAMIPLFTLGIPGSAATAIMFGGLLMHGMVPGNELFTKQAASTYAIFLGFLFANILMGILGFSLAKQLAKVSMVPNSVLIPVIIAISVIGTYALRNNMSDVVIMVIFGIIGYFMRVFGFDTAPLVLGMVLSNILESNFRRALIMSRGDLFGYFLHRPISIIIAIIILATIFGPMINKAIKRNKAVKAA